MLRRPRRPTLFPYTTLFRSEDAVTMTFRTEAGVPGAATWNFASLLKDDLIELSGTAGRVSVSVFGNEPVRLETRSEEHTSELQSQSNLVCRLLLEKKN